MTRRLLAALVGIFWLALNPAMAQPKPVTLWHVFNLETDMIYGGIKSFNETQSKYRIDVYESKSPFGTIASVSMRDSIAAGEAAAFKRGKKMARISVNPNFAQSCEACSMEGGSTSSISYPASESA